MRVVVSVVEEGSLKNTREEWLVINWRLGPEAQHCYVGRQPLCDVFHRWCVLVYILQNMVTVSASLARR